MKGLKNMLTAELVRLEQIIRTAKKQLKDAPQGTLRLSKSQNCVQYYYCTEEKKNGAYIAKSNEAFIRKLAQKSYDEKVLRLAEKRAAQIKRLVKDYEDDEIADLYVKEHVERQKFIKPAEETWEQKLKVWKARDYIGKEFQEDAPVILTERGERVRSKSEKIMADYFFRHGIEYKYECPLFLKGVGVIYPDFTFLSRKSGKEIYWEHNGKMDDPIYARSAVRKIQSYENNDIFPGERLILTYETEQTILNTNKIEKLVNRYLI